MKKKIYFQIPEDLTDRMNDISKEYNIDSDLFITTAIKKLLDDIEFIRELRFSKYNNL